MTLCEAVERAAFELPFRWSIVLEVEQGAGCLELLDPSGTNIDGGPDAPDESLADCVLRLIARARVESE